MPSPLPLLLALAAPAPFAIPLPNNVHSIPASGAHLDDTYTCFGGATARLTLELDTAGVRIASLSGFGRVLGEADRSQWNRWLADLIDLRSSTVRCTTDGVVVFITGTVRDSSIIQTIVVAWVGDKIINM